jgi:hypothetical protein
MTLSAKSLLDLTVTATGAITKYRAVKVGSGAQATVQGERVLGIAQTTAATGDDINVTVKGTSIAEAGAAISKGARLIIDAQGRVITAGTFAVANPAIARDDTKISASAPAITRDDTKISAAAPGIAVDDTKLTVDAGAVPVTSTAADGAIISAAAGFLTPSAGAITTVDGFITAAAPAIATQAGFITATQGALTGSVLPEHAFATALEAASGAGVFIEILLD